MMKHPRRCSLLYLRLHILQVLEDNKNLGDCGFTSSTARAQAPATIGMAYRAEGKQRLYKIYLFD